MTNHDVATYFYSSNPFYFESNFYEGGAYDP